MSDEKIQLPDFLIAELYKGSLVDLSSLKVKEAPAPIEKIAETTEALIPARVEVKFLGDNEKRVCILVNQPHAIFLNDDDLTFLTTILKACQLNLADIAIINIAQQAIVYDAIKEQLHAEKIILFDVEPSTIKLPFLIPAFQIQTFDSVTIMVAPPLPYLNKPTQEGKLLKTKLWLSLKKIFNIG